LNKEQIYIKESVNGRHSGKRIAIGIYILLLNNRSWNFWSRL